MKRKSVKLIALSKLCFLYWKDVSVLAYSASKAEARKKYILFGVFFCGLACFVFNEKRSKIALKHCV